MIVLTTIFLVVGLAAALVADVLFLPSIILVVCGASRIKSEVWSGMMIKNRVLSPCRLVTAFTAAFVLLAVMQGPALANPFAGLAGSWKGVGTLEPLGGDAERVICRAKYNVSANTITQTITCAGTDYKINAVSKLTYSGGRLSGSWNEMIYGTGGGATGSVKGDTIFVRISGQDFDGRMSINVSGSRHTVKIMQFNAGSGEYRRVASLSLRR